jgi:UDP-N-acetylglucosamine--N-acetylmuramyl-(pentapeptide) pyrophosphoryl-undecaprenol N-acetylglucosamine transferase
MRKIALTGGGTAGHVTPNLALIKRLKEEGFEIHYLGTEKGMERKLVEADPEVIYHVIRSGKLRRYFSWQNFVDPFKVVLGYFDAKKVFKSVRPEALFSKGGFVSVPPVMAGRRCKIPVVLHESDYTPGLANRIAISYASKVLVTFEDTLEHTKGKGVFTGTPIRGELYEGNAQKGYELCGFSGQKPVLLCMGGSQGAQALNEALRNDLEALLKTFDIVHLCGKGKVSEEHQNIAGYKQFEYVGPELPDIFAATTLAVSRAGANSVFEFLALALPSLLIPLPLSASRGDQLQNAAYFERKGYSHVLFQEDITDESLYNGIMKLYEQRDEMKERMKADANADGTCAVLREIYSVMKGKND